MFNRFRKENLPNLSVNKVFQGSSQQRGPLYVLDNAKASPFTYLPGVLPYQETGNKVNNTSFWQSYNMLLRSWKSEKLCLALIVIFKLGITKIHQRTHSVLLGSL